MRARSSQVSGLFHETDTQSFDRFPLDLRANCGKFFRIFPDYRYVVTFSVTYSVSDPGPNAIRSQLRNTFLEVTMERSIHSRRDFLKIGGGAGMAALLPVIQQTSTLRDGQTIPLWTGPAPGALGTDETDIPAITVYLPRAVTANTPAMIVCPGGGYVNLAMNHEG